MRPDQTTGTALPGGRLWGEMRPAVAGRAVVAAGPGRPPPAHPNIPRKEPTVALTSIDKQKETAR